MTHRERLEAKLDKRQDWAAKAETRSITALNRAHSVMDGIPMGQPILVGHHSEAHARRDVARIDSASTKFLEEHKLAAHHASAAVGIAHQLKTSVFSDDDNAIEALEARIAANEIKAETYTAINKAWRKSKGDVAALVATDLCSEALAKTITETMRLCPWLSSPLGGELTGLRASIRKDRERIDEIAKQNARAEKARAAGGVLIEKRTYHDMTYATVTFWDRPDRATIDELKAAGYGWAQGSWVGDYAKLPDGIETTA